MRKVLIGETFDAAATNVTALLDTEIGIFAGDATDKFVVASGWNDEISQSIEKKPRKLQLKRVSPVTAVKQVWSVTFANGSSNTYDEFVIRVNINYYQGQQSRNSNVIPFSFTGIYANSAAIATKAAAVINEFEAGEVVATVSGNAVLITPKDINKSALLNVGAEFIPFTGNPTQTITVAKTVDMVEGVGDIAHIKSLLESTQYPTDRTRTESLFPRIYDESGQRPGYPYDIFYISFLNTDHIDGNGIGKAFSPMNDVVVCLPNGSDETEDFQVAVETLFGVNFENRIVPA